MFVRTQIVRSSNIYSHMYIPDAETVPHGSSSTEEREEEREDDEEEMTPEATINVKVGNFSQVDFLRQAIRTDSRHKLLV